MLTDAEAHDLTQQVFTAMGWRHWYYHGPEREFSPEVVHWRSPQGVKHRRLPDVRTNACLPHLLDWLDTPAFNMSVHRYEAYSTAKPLDGHGKPTEGAWMVALSDNERGVGHKYYHGDTLGEALGRAILAYCGLTYTAAKERADG